MSSKAAICRGEVVVICGPSGSGKSTLIKCVNGLVRFDRGTLAVEGVAVGGCISDMARLRTRTSAHHGFDEGLTVLNKPNRRDELADCGGWSRATKLPKRNGEVRGPDRSGELTRRCTAPLFRFQAASMNRCS